ncbi:MAG TPA: tetratricopeptide repeat protein [Polyangia bacterium]|jgi:tetratricopeptide (TPR) repeat protein|nr:tetratricopeptide repeat protein [Polyangia bacterium]
MRTLRHLLLPLFLVSVLVPAAAAPARAADESTAAQAREHYQKGTSYYDLGKYTEAIHEFEAAYELKNDPALLYNLAQSNRLAGNPEQALRFYRTYLRYVPKAPNRAEIDDRIKQLETLVNQKNAAQTTPPNQTIPPGGNAQPPVTTAPPAATTPVEPVQPAAPPPGAPPAAPPPEYVAPAPGTPTVYAPPPQIPDDHHTMIRAGAIVAGVGAGLFVIGAIYGGAAVGAANDVNDTANKGGTFDPKVEQRGKNYQKAEAAFMTLGVLTAATGGVLFFYGRHAAAQERASLTPVASSTGGGLSLRVTF